MARPGRPKKLPKGEKFFKKSFKFPYMREYQDFDYLHKLGPAELEWLSKFCHGYYQSGNTLPQEIQREAWRNFKAARYDLYSRNAAFGRGQELGPIEVSNVTASAFEDEFLDKLDASRQRERERAGQEQQTGEIMDEILLKFFGKGET